MSFVDMWPVTQGVHGAAWHPHVDHERRGGVQVRGWCSWQRWGAHVLERGAQRTPQRTTRVTPS